MILPQQPVSDAAIADHYDELDPFYRDIWGEHVHHGLWLEGNETSEEAVEKMVQLVAEKGNLRRGERVIDIGCGYGASARLLAENYGATVTAITMSPVQYAFAQRTGSGPELRYVLGNWYCHEFAPNNFDLAIAIESGEHMPDKVEFAKRAYHVLRRGGRFVLCAWLSADHVSEWQAEFLMKPICAGGRIPNLATAQEYIDAVTEAGFRAIGSQDLTDRVKRTWSIAIRRSIERIFQDNRYRTFLFDRNIRNRVFAFTMLRIWLAYQFGAMRYRIFRFDKP
ncbi:MAG TPA: class I SAM-dependent methyltransferase [Chthoniobacterales bacterium]|nr:class I SAM-dependent methyltransferase [Chthoniobacterales bacterium]